MNVPHSKLPPENTIAWKYAYKAANDSLMESGEFTDPLQRDALASAMAHAAYALFYVYISVANQSGTEER